MVKFLIDECLSLDLVAVVHGRGFVESSHVVWMGKAGWKDWELKPFILEDDWTLVTRNSVDFRGHADNPETTGQFADVPLHAGLVCIAAVPTVSNVCWLSLKIANRSREWRIYEVHERPLSAGFSTSGSKIKGT